MADERLKVLDMVQGGKITAAEGLELLKALDGDGGRRDAAQAQGGGRFLRIRVLNGQRTKVNVNVPLSLLKVAGKFANVGMKMIPEEARLELTKKGIDLTALDFDELVRLIDEGLVDGKLVDVDTEDPHEGRTSVEIYVE